MRGKDGTTKTVVPGRCPSSSPASSSNTRYVPRWQGQIVLKQNVGNLQYETSSEFLLTDEFATGGAGGFAGPSGQLNPAGDGAEGLSKNFYPSPAP